MNNGVAHDARFESAGRDPSGSFKSALLEGLSLMRGQEIISAFRLSRLAGVIPESYSVCSELNGGAVEGLPYARVSIRKPIMGAVFGSLFYDVTRAEFGRRTAQLISARSAAVIWLVDCLIDDFGVSSKRKDEILQTLSDSIKSGRVYKFNDLPQLSAASRQLSAVWRSLQSAPNRELFLDAFVGLANLARSQLSGVRSMDEAIELGGSSLKLLATAPYCWNENLSGRFLEAAHSLGGYYQLFDDLHDRGHDTAHGIRTFATEATDERNLVRDVTQAAGELMERSVSVLEPEERWIIKTLTALSLLGARQLRAYSSIAPLP